MKQKTAWSPPMTLLGISYLLDGDHLTGGHPG
jgi:hypothetical protein